MNLFTLVRFLLFDRKAMEEIGACRGAIWVGVAMTLLTAIARDYDGVYLLGQPYHLLVPLAASFVMATVTYVFLRFFYSEKQIPYTRFLTYFWLTAPLAFIYAVPVERMMSPVGAAEANLWLLALVATWRVILLARVVSVCESASFWATLCKILFIADCVVLLVLFMTPLPIFNLMGGIHLDERDRMIAGLVFMTRLLGLGLGFVLLIVNFFLLLSSWLDEAKDVKYADADNPDSKLSEIVEDKKAMTLAETFPDFAIETADQHDTFLQGPACAVARSVWIGMSLCLLLGIGLLIWAQPEQTLRYQAERLLKSGKLAEGLTFMLQYSQGDFPPHWSPPPSLAWHEKIPNPVDLAAEAIKPGYAPWVQRHAIDRFSEYVGFRPHVSGWRWHRFDQEELERALKILEGNVELEPGVLETANEALTEMASGFSIPSSSGEPEKRKQELAIEYLKRNKLPLPENYHLEQQLD